GDDGVSAMALIPLAETFQQELTERRGGLYWEDVVIEDGKTVRFFLPNFLNSFREALGRERAYSQLVQNRGIALDLLGREDEARQHAQEGYEFAPDDSRATAEVGRRVVDQQTLYWRRFAEEIS